MNLATYLKSSIGQKNIMALTGAALVFFILTHLIGNSTTFAGRQSFLLYAEKLHSLGAVIPIFEVSLLCIFATHLFFGTALYFQNIAARPTRYAVNREAGGSTLGSKTMPYTGLIILFFIIIHLLGFHFTDGKLSVADLVRHNLQQPLMALLYIVSLAALAIHISHGFWSIFQTLGLNNQKQNIFIKNLSVVLSIIIGAVFMLIPAITLIYKDFLL